MPANPMLSMLVMKKNFARVCVYSTDFSYLPHPRDTLNTQLPVWVWGVLRVWGK